MTPTLLVTADDASAALLLSPAANAPNIKRFLDVRPGRQIARVYSRAWGGPNCSNARAKWMCGGYSHRPYNRVFGLFDQASQGQLPSSTATLLPRAEPGGEATHVGKWHLSQHSDTLHPLACGFQAWSGSMANLNVHGPVGGDDYGGQYGTGWWRVDWDGADVLETTYATTWATDEGIAAIGDGVPLVSVAYNAIHKPLHRPPDALLEDPDAYDWQDPGSTLLAMVEALDHELGRLLAAALSAGYAVLWGTDNGGDAASGGKASVAEAAILVPLAVSGVQNQLVGPSDAVVDATDVHATVWGLVHGQPVTGTDGISLEPELAGLGHARVHAFADKAAATGGGLPAKWDRAVRGERYKLIARDWVPPGPTASSEELYDLLTDPGETVNLIGDAGLAGEAEALRAALVASFA